VISLYFRTNSLVASAAVQGIAGARDMNIYRLVNQWYIYKAGDQIKATP
jgi:hypothetical protein